MILHHSIKATFHFRSAEHPWEKAMGAALTMGLCILIGVIIGNISWGLLASVGGFASLYIGAESFAERALKLLLVGVGLSLSIGLGTLSADNLWAMALTLSFVSMVATLIARAFQMSPPGGYFFILVCALGTGLPIDASQAPVRFSFALLGATIAWLVSMTGWMLYQKTAGIAWPHPFLEPMRQAATRVGKKQSGVLPATIRIGIAVLAATFIAFVLGNPHPYWVPLTCASVLQGATVTATVQRTLQRALGTALGVLIGGAFLALHPSAWYIIIALMAFQWIAEMLIVRNYGLAVIFITPIPLLLAEAGYPELHTSYLIHARLLDTLLGCVIGIIAAFLPWCRWKRGV